MSSRQNLFRWIQDSGLTLELQVSFKLIYPRVTGQFHALDSSQSYRSVSSSFILELQVSCMLWTHPRVTGQFQVHLSQNYRLVSCSGLILELQVSCSFIPELQVSFILWTRPRVIGQFHALNSSQIYRSVAHLSQSYRLVSFS